MFLTVDCPDALFTDGLIPAVMTGDGVRLEAVEDVPAGPWLAAVLDGIDPTSLSEWDLPAYLRACARMQAWAAARVSDGVAELAARPGGFGADKEVALALREPTPDTAPTDQPPPKERTTRESVGFSAHHHSSDTDCPTRPRTRRRTCTRSYR